MFDGSYQSGFTCNTLQFILQYSDQKAQSKPFFAVSIVFPMFFKVTYLLIGFCKPFQTHSLGRQPFPNQLVSTSSMKPTTTSPTSAISQPQTHPKRASVVSASVRSVVVAWKQGFESLPPEKASSGYLVVSKPKGSVS